MSLAKRIPFYMSHEQSKDAYKWAKLTARGENRQYGRFSPIYYPSYYRGKENISEGTAKIEKGTELVNRPTTSKTWNFVYKAGGTVLKVYGYAQRTVGKVQRAMSSKYGKFKEEVLDNYE